MEAFTFERLPPERESRGASAAPAGSCCCCCCCCLHSVGSLLGAVTATPPAVPADQPPTAVIGTDDVAPKYTIAREYWLAVLFVCSVATPIFFYVVSDGRSARFEVGESLLVYAMVFPALQLAASLLTLVLCLSSRRPGREQRLRHLGTITWRTFVGGLIGFIVMLPLFGLL